MTNETQDQKSLLHVGYMSYTLYLPKIAAPLEDHKKQTKTSQAEAKEIK